MTQLTVLLDGSSGGGARSVPGSLELGHALVEPADLAEAVGWELKPEGLCRAEMCVAIRDQAKLRVGNRLDLREVASALDQPILVTDDDALVVLGEPRDARQQALVGHVAPDFTLPDLDGALHSLDEWTGRKRILFAFSSW